MEKITERGVAEQSVDLGFESQAGPHEVFAGFLGSFRELLGHCVKIHSTV
jgi:hypothetical protein